MARLELRVSDEQKEQLLSEAVTQRLSLSELVRQRVLGGDGGSAQDDALRDHERRITRLEEIAGL